MINSILFFLKIGETFILLQTLTQLWRGIEATGHLVCILYIYRKLLPVQMNLMYSFLTFVRLTANICFKEKRKITEYHCLSFVQLSAYRRKITKKSFSNFCQTHCLKSICLKEKSQLTTTPNPHPTSTSLLR